MAMSDLPGRLPLLADPPVRLLWLSGANPMAQGPDRGQFRQALAGLDLVVVVDREMTQTAAEADILLPTTTYLEHADLNAGYWHHDVALNQRAIAPLFEARSDLAIAQALAGTLNRLRPGFCPFPETGSEEEWLTRLWGEEVRQLVQADGWEALRAGPRTAALAPIAWQDLRFATPSGRFELWSARADQQGLPPMATYVPPAGRPPAAALRLLTPHPAEGLNSQFHTRTPGRAPALPAAEVHPELAARLGLFEGAQARLVNGQGALTVEVRLTRTVPEGCVVVYSGTPAGAGLSVNVLSEQRLTDMGALTGGRGAAFGDTFVSLEPLAKGGEAP